MFIKKHWHSGLFALMCALMGVGQILAFSIATKDIENGIFVVYLSCIPAALWLCLSYCLAMQSGSVRFFVFRAVKLPYAADLMKRSA
jgi:hypothetical protein